MATPKTITMKTATQLAMRFQGTDDKLQDVANWVGGVIFRDTPTPTLEFPVELLPQNLGGGHNWKVVRLGEWLVQRPDGGYNVLSDDEIKAEYDVVG